MDGSKYSLRRLEFPGDAQILQMFHDAYDSEYGFERTVEDKARFHAHIQERAQIYHCLVLYVDGVPAGYMRGYERLSTSTGDSVFMLDIVYVLPGMRGRGAGRKMIGSLIEYLNKMGIARIDLLVDIGNETAKNLYSSFGFKGRMRMQMHCFLRERKDLAEYFEKKVKEESAGGP